MPIHEFEIINKYFNQYSSSRNDVILGIGDDAALLDVSPNKVLAISTDTLVAGVHFPTDTPAIALGHKALAVNLSDLAAMGAEPAWFTLNLTLPENDEVWLQQFCDGMFALAQNFNVALIGGDLTKGPLTISITIYGWVEKDKALTRAQAQPGDKIFVSGTLGDAGAALALLKKQKVIPAELLQQLQYPQPQVELGLQLQGLANAAIDISDGLVADLNHILEASKVGATINVDKIPLSQTLLNTITADEAKKLALTSGDDYKLCFTMSPAVVEQNAALLKQHKCVGIGKIEKELGLRLEKSDGTIYELNIPAGYQHF